MNRMRVRRQLNTSSSLVFTRVGLESRDCFVLRVVSAALTLSIVVLNLLPCFHYH
jgi:hypothetical protein